MSEPGMIYTYRQLTPFTTQGSGTAQWCQGERDGNRYFIKEFLSPTLPPEGADMAQPMNQARRDACIRFYRHMRRLYTTLQSVNNGCLICPDGEEELFVHDGHYCAVSPFIVPDVAPEAICTLTPWERIVLARTLVLSLSAVHEAGIVHSDIKLDNLMVTRNVTGACNLKLIDFDSGFFAEEPPASPETMHGDFAYLAPETLLFMAEEPVPLTNKLDVFALGLVLHQMWCGAMPSFPGEFRCAGEAMLAGAPVTLDPGLPSTLAAVIAGMLAADPADRPDLAQVYRDLETVMAELEGRLAPDAPEAVPYAAAEEAPYEAPAPAAAPVRPRRKDRSGLVIGIAAAVLILSALVIALLILKG